MRKNKAGIALLCMALLTGCGSASEKIQWDETVVETVTLGNATFQVPSGWEKDSYEDTRYYYLEEGMVMVQYLGTPMIGNVNAEKFVEYITPSLYSEAKDFAVEGMKIEEIGDNDWLCVDVTGSEYRGYKKEMQVERLDVLLVEDYFLIFQVYTKEGETMNFEEAYKNILASVDDGVAEVTYVKAPETIFKTTALENGYGDTQMYITGELKSDEEIFGYPVFIVETEQGEVLLHRSQYRGIWDIAVGDKATFYFQYSGFSETENKAAGEIRGIEKE